MTGWAVMQSISRTYRSSDNHATVTKAMIKLAKDGFGYFNGGRFYKNPHISAAKLEVYFVTMAEYMRHYYADKLPSYKTKSLTDKVIEVEDSMYKNPLTR